MSKMSKTIYPPTLLCDFYKVSHREQYPEGIEYVYSTFTPRSNKYFPRANKVVVFGIQAFVKKYLIEYFNQHFFNREKNEVIAEYVRYIKYTLGIENVDYSHIESLHELGYLPIRLKALKEGTKVPMKVPVLTIENTHPELFWVTNYLETIMSSEIWLPMTSATIAHEYRKLLNKHAIETTGSTEGVEFQGHDFSMRGMSSLESAIASGASHLLSFVGTDTIPAIAYLEHYYNANIEEELVGTSIPATEHSVMCSYGKTNEFELFKRLITEVYPNGFFSVVSDTWDFWKVIEEYLPVLKNEILARDGRVVIRPDSGDPVKILCGRNIEDLTNNRYVKSLEDAKEYVYDGLVEQVRDETPHGECGEDSAETKFKYDGKYYKLEVQFDWNRYDKQYYYMDGDREILFEEFTPEISDIGLIEALWDIFGGSVTEQGYKVLNPKIGAIYGDSITLERAEQIVKNLKNKGFASTNVVFGIGSYTYQHNTRDTFGFAMKATYAQVNGEERLLFKDPKTDDGTKKSQRGKVKVFEKEGEISFVDGLYKNEIVDGEDLLEVVFENGRLIRDESLAQIRLNLNK